MKTLGQIVLLGLAAFVSAQIPIPKEELGFVYREGSPTAHVFFDVYIDALCGDSKEAWPNIIQVADHYGPTKLQLTTHVFALPYLGSGFMAGKGAHIVEKQVNTNRTYAWISKVFEHFDELKISASRHMSEEQKLDKFADLAAEVGVEKATFKTMFNASEIESVARVEWKYSCTRGVAATPTFMLNDVIVDAGQSWTLDRWKDMIDPLIPTTPAQ